MTDAATFQKSNFDVKDFLVVVPLVGSSIAVCWEVGTFLPICHGGWSCLSLTEHINRALQALPLALGFASGAIVVLLAILAPLSPDTAPNETQELAGEKSKDRGRRTTTRSQLPAALIFAAIVIVLGIYFRLFTPPLFGVLLVLYVLGQKVQVLPLRTGLVFIGISLLRSRRSYNAPQPRGGAVLAHLSSRVHPDEER